MVRTSSDPIAITLKSSEDVDDTGQWTIRRENLGFSLVSIGLVIVGYISFVWWAQSFSGGRPIVPIVGADESGLTIVQPTPRDLAPYGATVEENNNSSNQAATTFGVSQEVLNRISASRQKAVPTKNSSNSSTNEPQTSQQTPIQPSTQTPNQTPPANQPPSSPPASPGPVQSVINGATGTVNGLLGTVNDLL